jgi:hypothetical protein
VRDVELELIPALRHPGIGLISPLRIRLLVRHGGRSRDTRPAPVGSRSHVSVPCLSAPSAARGAGPALLRRAGLARVARRPTQDEVHDDSITDLRPHSEGALVRDQPRGLVAGNDGASRPRVAPRTRGVQVSDANARGSKCRSSLVPESGRIKKLARADSPTAGEHTAAFMAGLHHLRHQTHAGR